MAKVVGVGQNWDILCKNLIKCILLEAGPDMIFSLLIPKGIGGTENIIGSHKPIQFQSSLGTYTRLLNVNHRYNWLSLLLLWSISHHEHWIRKYWMISPRRNTGLDSYEPLVTFWSNNQYIFNVFLFNLKKWHLTLNIVHSLALSSWPMVLSLMSEWSLPNSCSVQFSHSVVFDSLRPHGLQHARPPCPPQTPRVYPISSPLSRWYHPTIWSSVVPFSSHLQSFPASGYFPMSQLFTSGGQIIGVSASTLVLPMNIQDWFPL